MTLLLVGIGSALGAACRYAINRFFEKRPHPFPKATLFINLTGAFILGFFVGMQMNHTMYLFFATGLMGGYTTFSTMNFELFLLLKENKRLFRWYFISTYVLGLLASFLGIICGSFV